MEERIETIENNEHATLVISHRVRPNKRSDFEEWLRGITRAAVEFEGYLGFNLVRPTNPGKPEYLIFLRFDTFAHLEKWEKSETRREWLERVKPLTVAEAQRERHTGLEVWFTPPTGCTPPPRYKMVVVTLLAIYPLISTLQMVLIPHLMAWPTMLRTLVTSALLICLMTYLVMPLVTRLFSRWLYRKAKPKGDEPTGTT